MSHNEQQRRRALKRARRLLDRQIESIARAGKGLSVNGLPSTRSKQAKWHHELAHRIHGRIDAYQSIVSEMRAIDRDLARELARDLEDDLPCACRFAGDTFDPRGCPAHDPEVPQPWA